MSKSPKKSGVCRLTEKTGKFAKCHILPQALMEKASKSSLLETSRKRGLKKKWSPWYDYELVVTEGEKILSKIDDEGIKELRRNQLVWSGWPMSVPPKFNSIDASRHGLRSIENPNFLVLQHFFLSIVWRAGVSQRDEMQYIDITKDEEAKIRNALLNGEELFDDFSISLTQLSTLGHRANFSPLSSELPQDTLNNEKPMPIWRIYIDGLIAHIHRTKNAAKYVGKSDQTLFLGKGKTLVVLGVPFEDSWQWKNMMAAIKVCGP